MPKQNHLMHVHLSRKKEITWLDRLVLLASIISPVTGIPQMVNVFHGHVQGVSLSTWLGFIFFAVIFFLYGLVHKIKPMIISNFLWIFVEVAVVIGVLLNR